MPELLAVKLNNHCNNFAMEERDSPSPNVFTSRTNVALEYLHYSDLIELSSKVF